MKEVIPLIGVVIGGFIALLGGIILRYLGSSEERKKIKQKKMEEAYTLLDDLHLWVMDQMRDTVRIHISKNESDTKGNSNTCPMRRIKLLIRFYEPSLRDQADSLNEAVKKFQSNIFKYYQETATAKKKLPDERYAELFVRTGKRLEESQKSLMVAIENKVHAKLI